MKTRKINYWKVATIILGIVIILIVGYDTVIYKQQQEIMSFGNFEIDKYSLNQFEKVMEVGQSAKICNLEQGQCMELTKINS